MLRRQNVADELNDRVEESDHRQMERPKVYAVRKGRSGWTLSRRGLLAAAASAVAITKAGTGRNARERVPVERCPFMTWLSVRTAGYWLQPTGLGCVGLWSLPDGALLKDLSFGS